MGDELAHLFEGVFVDEDVGICAVSEADEFLGVAHARICRPGIAYLAEFWVLPGSQGRGVGRALLSGIWAKLAKHGITKTKLFCIRSNEAACKFYTSLGVKVLP